MGLLRIENPGMLVFHIAIAILMVATGTINTLAAKWADMLRAEGTNPVPEHIFDHPYFQAAEMFLGELMCMFAFNAWYYFRKCRKQDMSIFGPQKFLPFVWAIPAMCDLLGTSTMYVGLTWTFAASFQMLRGSVIIFTGLLSVAFLGTKLRIHHWSGMGCVILGLILVGVGDYLFTNDKGTGMDPNYILAGDLLIVLAQVITAIQMTIEEKLIKKYKVPPLQAVGWEGFFGFVVLAIAMIPMYFIPWHLPATQDVWQMQIRFEDAIDAFVMLGHNWQLLFASVGTVISISFFNFAGLTVTSTMNATTRMVLDSVRTIFIWGFSLGITWQQFNALQPVGYFILFVGTCVYYDIILVPLIRFVYRKIYRKFKSDYEPIEDEKLQPESGTEAEDSIEREKQALIQ
jgi:drug/metabolite transporter (DMT)-like permease